MAQSTNYSRNNRLDIIYTVAIISLLGYVFLSDFVYAMLHIAFFKPLTALGTLLFGGTYIVLGWKNILYKRLLILTSILTVFYIAILHNEQSNYLYTPIFGILLVQKPSLSLKVIDKIFILQFILLIIEFVTRHHLYTQITTGLFIIRELDFDYDTLMDETGFKCKGMFVGVLVATCFTINYSLINRNNYIKSFWALVMAILINGRLAILICGLIFLYNFYIKKNRNRTSFNIPYLILYISVIIIGVALFAATAKSTAAQNLLNVFDFQETSNAGRLMRYALGIEALSNYTSKELLLGSTYELFDQYNRLVPTESDALGMLLEIGMLGFSLVLVGLIIGFKSGNSKVFMSNLISHKFALLMSIIAIIQYRHLAGNLRGLMFWFLLLLIISENRILNKTRHENHIYC